MREIPAFRLQLHILGSHQSHRQCKLCGSLVLAVGLWLRFDPNTKSLLNADNAPQTFFFAVYILMGVGGIMMLVGFFGCCGAVRESQCLLGLIINEVKNFYSTSFNTTSGFTKITFVYHNNLECCGDLEGKSNTSLCTTNNTKDCLKAIEDFFNEKLIIIGYVGIGTAGIMIIGMIFSIVLCRGIRSNREVL
ncbi:tetraspanin-2a isoform X3 [Ictalurus furcatus]|uniref:tetraspanin-2a isoform X3 n=1 Tax=Ictalurus furcatus TaxID=66913 RepID=UPI0023500059|nr:tetraspanin-2a isoform X3 [Ictalurus furcatus]